MGGEGGPTFGNFPHIISFLVSEGLPKAGWIIPTCFQFSSSSSSLPEAELPDRLVEKPIQRLQWEYPRRQPLHGGLISTSWIGNVYSERIGKVYRKLGRLGRIRSNEEREGFSSKPARSRLQTLLQVKYELEEKSLQRPDLENHLSTYSWSRFAENSISRGRNQVERWVGEVGEDFGGNRFHFFGRVCRLLGPTGEHLLAIHLYILSASTIIIEIFTFQFSLYIGVSGPSRSVPTWTRRCYIFWKEEHRFYTWPKKTY